MSSLIIRKKSLKTWLHIDSVLGQFIISKFYFNADGLNFQIVEQGQSKRVIYNVSDITLYDDVNSGGAETFSTITELSLRLEELKYPAFYVDGSFNSITGLINEGTNINITGSGTEADPYVINSTGGGGVGTLQEVLENNSTAEFYDDGFTKIFNVKVKKDDDTSFSQIFQYGEASFNNLTNVTDDKTVDVGAIGIESNKGIIAIVNDLASASQNRLLFEMPDGVSENGDVVIKNPNGSVETLAFESDIPAPITIDATPTDGSSNAVSSNGVFDALATKQDGLGYTPENVSNKSTNVATDQASNTKYPSVKAVFDWASGVFTTTSAVATQITTALTGYATQAWVNSQGFITNVVTALGYTPENSANKSTSTADSASTTKFPVWSAILSYFDASRIRTILGISTLSGSNTGDQDLSGLMVKANNGSDIANIATFRTNLGVDKLTSNGNSNYTILSTDKAVVTSATLTASRTWTLPLANSVNAGYEIIVADLFGAINGSNTIVIARSGSDTINGATSQTIGAQYGMRRLISDGVSKWTFDGGVMRISDYIGTTLTASKIVATDSNSKLQPLDTATYPDLTELSRVKGVTSAIQTQLDAKVNKSRTLFASGASLTGVATEANIQSLYIPANTIQSEDAYTLTIPTFKSVTAGNITYNVYLGATSGARTTLIGTFLVASNTRSTVFERFLSFVSGNLYLSSNFTTNANSPFTLTTGNLSSQTVAYTVSNDYYITISANPSVVSEVIQVLDMTLTPRR